MQRYTPNFIMVINKWIYGLNGDKEELDKKMCSSYKQLNLMSTSYK